MAVPILLGVDGQAREIVEEFGAGLYFEPENEASFLARLSQLRDDCQLYDSLRDGGRRLAAAYDRKRLAGEMRQALERVARRG